MRNTLDKLSGRDGIIVLARFRVRSIPTAQVRVFWQPHGEHFLHPGGAWSKLKNGRAQERFTNGISSGEYRCR